MTPDPIGLAGGINPFVYVLNNPINAVDPFGLETLYDHMNRSSSRFLGSLRSTNPTEYRIFRQYSEGINTDLWNMNDIRYLEMAWRGFDQYAQQTSEEMLIGSGCENVMESHYGPSSWIGPYLGGGLGLISGAYSSISTAISINSLPEIDPIEASNIATNGPAVINETTWTEAFGPYTPGLEGFRPYIPNR